MRIPRFNNFKVTFPNQCLPEFMIDMYKDILRDDPDNLLKIYNGNPINCITESVVGIHLPGMHLKLVEQTKQDIQGTGSVIMYWPKGVNNMRVLDDNEMSFQFRHMDGLYNYFMLRGAVAYMADDNAQSAQGETFKTIGDLSLMVSMSKNWATRHVFTNVVYSAIDGTEFSYSNMASEQTFTVRAKFTYYYTEYWYKDKCISKIAYNHNLGN